MNSEHDHPNLSLGRPPRGLENKTGHVPRGWLWLLLLLQVGILGCLVAMLTRPVGPPAAVGTIHSGPAPDSLRAIAMELEDRGLNVQAARAWQAYLAADPTTDERAGILYRVGKLYFDADQFDEAAAALVRAQLAGADNKPLQAKIGPKLVDCLRRLGRYGEVGRELSRQVEVGGKKTAKGQVLATLAGEPLTEADLDRMVERQVDQMLQLQGRAGDQTARKEILRHFSGPKARRQMLQDLLQVELLSRRARELKLDKTDDFRQARDQMEQSLLARRLLQHEYEKIQPTDVDLESYYQMNRQQYQQPASMDVVAVALRAGEDPAPLLKRIQSADDFRKLAREHRPAGEKSGTAPTHHIVRGGQDPVFGDTSDLFKLGKGQWTKEPHVAGKKKYLVLVETKTEARTPPLTEVRARVRSDYVARKRQELTAQLIRELMARYDVHVVPPKPPAAKDRGAPTNKVKR